MRYYSLRETFSIKDDSEWLSFRSYLIDEIYEELIENFKGPLISIHKSHKCITFYLNRTTYTHEGQYNINFSRDNISLRTGDRDGGSFRYRALNYSEPNLYKVIVDDIARYIENFYGEIGETLINSANLIIDILKCAKKAKF